MVRYRSADLANERSSRRHSRGFGQDAFLRPRFVDAGETDDEADAERGKSRIVVVHPTAHAGATPPVSLTFLGSLS